jgi:hypothetical protein
MFDIFVFHTKQIAKFVISPSMDGSTHLYIIPLDYLLLRVLKVRLIMESTSNRDEFGVKIGFR